ncbi:MAG: hypothetical protein PHX21_00720 [bacterium]|nr:hypothetical protein [bacterium]
MKLKRPLFLLVLISAIGCGKQVGDIEGVVESCRFFRAGVFEKDIFQIKLRTKTKDVYLTVSPKDAKEARKRIHIGDSLRVHVEYEKSKGVGSEEIALQDILILKETSQ